MRTIARRKLKRKTPKASVGQRAGVVKKRDKQISFYCTQEFYGQIQAEKVLRGLTTQEMATKALTEYFRTTPAEDLRKIRQATSERLDKYGRAPIPDIPEYHLQRWIDLCVKYFQRMPLAKRSMLEEFMILDLKHYGSSRLKARD